MILTIKFDTNLPSLTVKRLTIEGINSQRFFWANLTIEITLRLVFMFQLIKNIGNYKFKLVWRAKFYNSTVRVISRRGEFAQSMNHGKTLLILFKNMKINYRSNIFQKATIFGLHHSSFRIIFRLLTSSDKVIILRFPFG